MLASIWLVGAPLPTAARTHGMPLDGVVVVARRLEHRITPTDTFADLLADAAVPRDEIARWQRAARPIVDLDRLSVGRMLNVDLDASGRVLALRYDLAGEVRLIAERTAPGRIALRREPVEVRLRTVGARATVGRNIKDAAMQAGIPDAVVSQVVDLLSWRLDFQEDVHRGDRVRILWEQRTRLDGRPLAAGRVLAVEYEGRTDSAAAYLYEADGAAPTYVDAEGHPLDGAPLRFPLEFTRITSAFSDARLHPILHQSRPHLGVDFAAPAGTPVRAIGPAAVRFNGVQSGFGNHVELDHGTGFVSTYSHLQRIAPELAVGAEVKRGQLVGWVGQTGLATGPHLHFAIFQDGEYVDPLAIEYPPQLGAVDETTFGRLRWTMKARLRALPQSSPAAPTAPEIGLPPLAQMASVGPITLTF